MQTGTKEDYAVQTRWFKMMQAPSRCQFLHCTAIFANLQKTGFQKCFLEQIISSKYLNTKTVTTEIYLKSLL